MMVNALTAPTAEAVGFPPQSLLNSFFHVSICHEFSYVVRTFGSQRSSNL